MRKPVSIVFLLTAIITIIALVLSGCTSTPSSTTSAPPATTQASKEPIKIGLLDIESGVYAGSLQFYQPSAKIAIDKINAAGGLLGRQVQLVTRDWQGDPSLIRQMADQLKAAGCVAISGALVDNGTLALQQWAVDGKIPVDLCVGSISARTTTFNKYSFFSQPDTFAQANVLMKSIAAQSDVKSIYSLSGDISFVHEIYDDMWNPKTGINTIKPDIVNLGVTWADLMQMDFSNEISAILAKNPSIIYSGLGGPPYVSFIQQAQQFNLFNKTKMIGIFTAGPDATTSFGKNFPQGIQDVTWCPFNLNEKPMQDFVQAYLKSANVYPADISMQFYLGFVGIISAIQKAGSTDPDKIMSAMDNLTFDSPLGSITVDAYAHQFHIPMWYGVTGNSPDFPIAILNNLVKYQEGIYPTEAQITSARSAK
jgi:branched-chain amino acid transport system substrate-binding protein